MFLLYIAHYLFLTIQLQILNLSSLCYESSFSEFSTDSEVQTFNFYETLYFKRRNEHETPCAYFENDYLELLSSYDVCAAFQIIISSSHDMCMIWRCSPTWDETCVAMYFENEFLELILSSYDKCMWCGCSQEWDRTQNAVYFGNKSFELVSSSNEKCITHISYKEKSKTYKLKNKTPLHQRLPFCSIILTTSECNFLEYLFDRILIQRHEYAVCWLKRDLVCLSAFIIYSYCILRSGRRGGKTEKKMKSNEKLLTANYHVERNDNFKSYFRAGGRHQNSISGEIVCEYLDTCTDIKLLNNSQYFKGKQFEFKGYQLLHATLNDILDPNVTHFFSKIPLNQLSIYLNMKELREVSILHNISIPGNIGKETMLTFFVNHRCIQCDLYISVLEEKIIKKRVQSKKKKEKKTENFNIPSESPLDSSVKFPPDPPSNSLLESIIEGFCNDSAPQNFVEAGCAVCGRLSAISHMILLDQMNCDLNTISPGDIGRYERVHKSDPVRPLKGPILAEGCQHVCQTCQCFLKKKKMPPESLANSFWIGSVPSVLQNLTFAEKMLISRIRHNKCLLRVSSGRAKMTANVIMFSNPTVKVYHALPPSRSEISEILAFVFQGPIQPTESDIKRTPMLVRRNVVKDALEWLKLNHSDYEDLQISYDNLNDYPLAGVPVNIEYSKSDPDSGNKIASTMSVYDDEFEDGTTDGPCPFTVHGLTGPEFENMSIDRLKARALQHLAEKGTTLGISHDSKPQSMYDNPQAYPQMFPWLFPYGSGGIGQKCHFAKVSETTHKKNLLMYHDKRFQTDFYFPMIAFNHEQLKASVTGSFLLAKRKMWPDISNRLKSLNLQVLKNISDKLSDGVHFTTTTAEEKKCFQLLSDLDHVGGFVKGSITSKKYMRNELWSMISLFGAPSWFITLSPADSRHPICLYYADKNIEFKPDLRSANERNLLVAQNPVAAAHFFDFMVRMFIKHVLGVGSDHMGLYGNTAGYYGIVEQQGRLTLHLHMVLWILNALSPQEIRNKLMNKDGEFQQSLIQYLEGCQKGEFLTGSMEYVKSKIPADLDTRYKGIHTIFNKDFPQSIGKSYQDPTQTLPEGPPTFSESNGHTNCDVKRPMINYWWMRFNDIVDDILLRSNVHKCSSSDPENPKFKAKGCLNKDGICKARFPRSIIPETIVNFEDGYIDIKKAESMLNTISPCVTYLFRCNTDVTSLLSGTSIKAVISYVTDYMAKPSLKTYQIFSAAYNIFDRNANLNADDNSRTDDARKLILKIVNALSSKMEIGSPMASMYLLQNPDHYVSHKFIPFWWKSFVNDITMSENSDGNMSQNHDTDNKFEDLFQEKEETLSRLSHVNIDNYFEMQMNDIDSSRPGINTSHSVDMQMDIDTPNNLIGVSSFIQRDVDANKKRSYNDIVGGHQFKNQEKCHDRNKEEDEERIEDEDGDENDVEDDPTDEKLLISQEGRDYVASSKVDDYKFRPEAYTCSSVYNWTRLSVKIRASRKVNDKTCLQFLPGHGQRNTHMVKVIPSRSSTFLLNFIGGPLPRCDQGDFEYYCRTMLTLFKPWRNVQDLKDAHQTWTEAFTSYEFNLEDKKVMKNFNLRYECLDERDDYHAILKRQSKLKENKTSSLFQDQYDNDCNLGISSNFEDDYGDQQILGPNAIKKAQQMIETEVMMEKSRGLDDGRNENWKLNFPEFHPAIHKSGSQWKNLVKQCRDKLLTVKKISYSLTTDASKKNKKNKIEPSSVKLLSAEYFMHDFQVKEAKDREIILKTILDFSLNKEQNMAFHIIANHASSPCQEQLKMHLGGMGGTGKTQVIKALISMFEQRQESHRFIVLAPTGTAAALLNGSTYHSILGIRSSNDSISEENSLRNEDSIIREVQGRLDGVDYIFIDEISMISCHELFAISSQLSKVTNEHNKAFGGKNIILAGDFAQLPPTNGSPLYSNTVSKTQKNSMTKRDQESTIGKILWHQMTTVVILTQNMRQTEMSEDDKKFRSALSNMRYAACTEDDLQFLKTLHVDRNQKEKTLSDPNFRNVSIITSLNTQKDQINESCSIRFARDTGQRLTHFYSIDKVGNTKLGRKKRGSRVSKTISGSTAIPIDIQKTLWDSSPHTSEHFPGKLSLCLGMPIMIRNNDATELCITKGQEAYVVGWDAIDGPEGKKVLETLFLELKDPPKAIELPHLPKNVIPMTRTSKNLKCSLPNDHEINIIRQQINVLPNFSMTDYGSQGKTRFRNPVNLSHCRNFQSIYTCLSRSSNAAGTLILQGFNPNKITKGLSGHLRQEFRELHFLSIITKDIYEGRLNKKYLGILRNPMLYKYQTEIKKNHSNNLHRALKLSDGELIIKDKGEDGTWNLNVYRNLTNAVIDRKVLKRKLSDLHAIDGNSNFEKKNIKKIRLSSSYPHIPNALSPIGLTWNNNDYSCAYDSLFTVLHHIWIEGQLNHKAYFENGTRWSQILHSYFISMQNKTSTFESVRNQLRMMLNHEKPSQYRYGEVYTDIDELVRDLTLTKSYTKSKLYCLSCKFSINSQFTYFQAYTAVGWCSADKILLQTASIQTYLNYKIIKRDERSRDFCPNCLKYKKERSLYVTQYISELPSVLIFCLAPWIDINQRLTFDVSNSSKEYILKGIIYSNNHHFTARLIDENLNVWYHDGQVTRSLCRKERYLIQNGDIVPLKTFGEYKAIMAFYTEK